jgi:uncharacterized protein involved in propanediol utilization
METISSTYLRDRPVPAPLLDAACVAHGGAAMDRAPIYSGICHGTLGELVQGPYVKNGEMHICLISLPLKRYSCAHFIPGAVSDPESDLARKQKCRRAIDLYLARHQVAMPEGRWFYDSELLEGKGMASSTADIVATIRCLDALFSRHSSPEQLAGMLREIERSDSVFLDSYALYLSGMQEVVYRFAGTPQFYACYIDEGGRVDTERAGARLLEHYARNLAPYSANIAAATTAFTHGDAHGIAACATASAVLGQDALPKRNLDALLRHQAEFGADGVFVAHTGSLLGYLFVREPAPMRMGALSSFFHRLGYRCRFVQTGI